MTGLLLFKRALACLFVSIHAISQVATPQQERAVAGAALPAE